MTTTAPPGSIGAPTRTEIRVVAVAVIVGLVIVVASLMRHDGDITGLIKFGGEEVAARTAHVEDVLGREVATVGELGHDGSMFFLQALDPLYVGTTEHSVHLDRPVYRSQRMLFPFIAGGGGLVPVGALPWTMAFVNLAAIALGTLGTARLALRMGGSPWLGLAFALNPGLVFEFDISGAGILAFACAIWGTLALEEGRDRRAIAWFAAAVLAREVVFLYLAGVLLLRLVRTRRVPWLLGIVPAAVAGAWALYIRLRLDSGTGVDEVQEFGMPFAGVLGAVDNWVDDPVNLAMVAAIALLIPLFVVRAVYRPTYVGWGSLGFVVLAILMSRQVWWNFFDITRAIAPVFTAYVLLAFTEPDAVEPGVSDVSSGPHGDKSLRPIG